MIADAALRGVRRWLAGPDQKFAFTACTSAPAPAEFTQVRHLYIHVPFCRHGCPYCPYNKIPLDPPLAARYFAALQREIAWYTETQETRQIDSLYFGGGSPSLFPDQIADLITQLSSQYDLRGVRCLEIHPNDCTESTLQRLRSAGITTISIGVQSFNDTVLKGIGRSYTGKSAQEAVTRTRKYFPVMNLDLMFALPGGSTELVQQDCAIAADLGADQVTTYPLFTFPYTSVGIYRRKQRVGMPRLSIRRRQYYALYDYLTNLGFSRVSVWSFMRHGGLRYSSVTRDGYLGFGAGAGTHLSGGYYLNTFSVPEYIRCIEEERYPTALKFTLDERLGNLFWLYWRFYDTSIPGEEFARRFSSDRKIQAILSLFRLTGLMTPEATGYRLTRRGAFWVHLAQNHLSLRSINTVWTRAMKEPFPDQVNF